MNTEQRKSKHVQRLVAACLLLSLAACEQVIDVPEPAHTPALAVRYTLGTTPADSGWNSYKGYRQLYVSASQKLFDTRPLHGLTTATARLYDAGGAVVEEFQPGPGYGGFGGDNAGYYVPTRNFTGQPGSTYRLRVEAPDYEAVESTLTLPAGSANVLGATYTPKADNGFGQKRGKLVVTLQDDGATADYYVATVRFLDLQGRPTLFGRVGNDDDDNGGSSTDFDAGRFQLSFPFGTEGLYPYADSDVSGRTFTLNADVVVDAIDFLTGQPIPGQIEVTISRLTADAYQFWLSLDRYQSVDGNPFAEPAPLRSNIPHGFGLFGGEVDTRVLVPLP